MIFRSILTLACLSFLAPTLSFAEEQTDTQSFDALSEDRDSSELERFSCNDYNDYGRDASYYCQQDRNCRWDGRLCRELSRPTPRRCEDIRNVNVCINTRGCDWDRNYGCYSAGGGGGGGGGGGSIYECTANDNGWEEHRGGHVAQGRTQNVASNSALRLCERFHGRCNVTSCRIVR